MQSYMMTYGGYCDRGNSTDIISANILWYGSNRDNYQARVLMNYWATEVTNPMLTIGGEAKRWYAHADWTGRSFIDKGLITLEKFPTETGGENTGTLADVDYVLVNVGTNNTYPKIISIQCKDVSRISTDVNYVGEVLKQAIIDIVEAFAPSTWVIKSAVVELHNS